MVLGFAVAGIAVFTILVAIVAETGPFTAVLAVPFFGFGVLLLGAGLLLWQAGVDGVAAVAATAGAFARTAWQRARTWPR